MSVRSTHFSTIFQKMEHAFFFFWKCSHNIYLIKFWRSDIQLHHVVKNIFLNNIFEFIHYFWFEHFFQKMSSFWLDLKKQILEFRSQVSVLSAYLAQLTNVQKNTQNTILDLNTNLFSFLFSKKKKIVFLEFNYTTNHRYRTRVHQTKTLINQIYGIYHTFFEFSIFSKFWKKNYFGFGVLRPIGTCAHRDDYAPNVVSSYELRETEVSPPGLNEPFVDSRTSFYPRGVDQSIDGFWIFCPPDGRNRSQLAHWE